MAYDHLHMPCILWEHLPNIPNECPQKEKYRTIWYISFFVFDSTVIG